ncbi:hypothetical protein ACFPRL_21385 [Pseudoclavibacter helvolus]
MTNGAASSVWVADAGIHHGSWTAAERRSSADSAGAGYCARVGYEGTAELSPAPCAARRRSGCQAGRAGART